MGAAGIPQPKPGACTRAHGGVLFIDEIGELHPTQINKLLKVLEDRKVMLESAYYTEQDKVIPPHIHDIFKNGLPADFRLIGATTRTPAELPPAIRSRWLEIFIKPLDKDSILKIIRNAAQKINMEINPDAREEIAKYADNGREAVNIVQLAAGIAQVEKQESICLAVIKKVLNNGRFSPRLDMKPRETPLVGVVNGLAVYGANVGSLIEVEAAVIPADKGAGKWTATGVIEEEQIGSGDKSYRRKSMAKGAVENVMTILKVQFGFKIKDFDLHINFPGGVPVDGPSAGVAMATAIYSALRGIPVDNLLAMTGELSVHGRVKPVGGVMSKVEAARNAGVKKVLIPRDNMLDIFNDFPDLEVVPVGDINEVFAHALLEN